MRILAHGHGCSARLTDMSARLLPDWLLLFVARVASAAIFFQSGRTKVEGFLTISPGTYQLFALDYKLPLLPPEIAAQVAVCAEHVLPILLVLGLFTRVAAAGLLLMTSTIQIFVFPDAWPTHLSWVGILLPLIAKGGGALSFDGHSGSDNRQ